MSTPPLTNRYHGATIAPGARIPETCRVDPGAQIGAEAVLEPMVVICSNVKILGQVHLARAVNIRENVTLVGPLSIGEETFIAPDAVIGFIRAENTQSDSETNIGASCRIGKGAQILAGVQIGNYARLRAEARLIGDLPPYGLASHDPAILERYACPHCGGMLRVFRAFREIVDTRCMGCARGDYRFSKHTFGSVFNRILLPNHTYGEVISTQGDDIRWIDEKELG